MSGPAALLQGLCIFPRSVTLSADKLTRITEAWLVGENAADGPTAVHAFGLWIGLGLRGQLVSFQVGFGTRDGAVPSTWVVPTGTENVEAALKKAFGANTAQWRGFHLRIADLPAGTPTWNALFFKIETKFQPHKKRDFHAVPVIVALAGGDEDSLGESHYLLGLTVFTNGNPADVEDFMVVTHAMHAGDGRPDLTIPPRALVAPPKASYDTPVSTPASRRP